MRFSLESHFFTRKTWSKYKRRAKFPGFMALLWLRSSLQLTSPLLWKIIRDTALQTCHWHLPAGHSPLPFPDTAITTPPQILQSVPSTVMELGGIWKEKLEKLIHITIAAAWFWELHLFWRSLQTNLEQHFANHTPSSLHPLSLELTQMFRAGFIDCTLIQFRTGFIDCMDK